MSRSACQTFCWKAVPRTSSGKSRPVLGISMKPMTLATVLSNASFPPTSRALGKRSWRSLTSALGSSPRKMAQTPFVEAATSTVPSVHSPTAKRMVTPSPPLRKSLGVMPSVWADLA